MKFISYTNDGRVAIQHAALILTFQRLPELCLHISVPPCRDQPG